jgi:hypothetical protein
VNKEQGEEAPNSNITTVVGAHDEMNKKIILEKLVSIGKVRAWKHASWHYRMN